MHLQLLELLQNSSFVKKFLREAKKSGCHYILVVCGLQINVS